jgi:hypothetical protein
MARIWDRLARPAGQAGRPLAGAAGLVICPICSAEAVVPVEWEDRGDEWRIALRCGNCGTRRQVTLDDFEAHDFDRALDRGVHQIARTAVVLERRRMEAEAEALSVALERDLIDAGDFARRSSMR